MYNPKAKFVSGVVTAIRYVPPTNAVNAGDVVVINGIAYIAESDIAVGALGSLVFSGGVWQGNKAAGAWVNGSPVYYDSTASPNVGTANSGAYTQTSSGTATFVGYAVASSATNAAAATGDQWGYFVKSTSGTGATAQGTTVAALGANQVGAAPLSAGFNFVTGANAALGVIIPAGVNSLSIKNRDSDNAVLLVYPPVGGTINAIATNTALSMAAKTACELHSVNGLNYYTVPLLPS